ncbi:MAG: peptidylprolyl isomerase [Ruminococcus sp.]|nr:peptidylprolyl isomerase [Ruminococcus sp.]
MLTSCEHRLDSSADDIKTTTTTTTTAEAESYNAEKEQSFVIALYPEYAPITAANFESLVSEGFYDGLTFHRVYKGFMAQGGNGSTLGRTAETIKGEFAANGVENNLSHKRGVVSMARLSSDYDSANSQFFIVYDDAAIPSLDGGYAAFGEVIEGMEVVDSFLDIPMEYGFDKIATVPTEPITIVKAELEGKDDAGHTLCRFYMHVGN